MRITDKMMTNNSLNNINKNKNLLSKLDQQYTSEKKIQKPSDDPIIAVRALKLRMNLSQIEQYYNKNIPDADSWMSVTESALKSVESVMKNIYEKCNSGANDAGKDLEARKSILADLKQMAINVYQEGDANCAGRYVFTGYKTDTSLIFKENQASDKYTITQNFSGQDIEKITRVTGESDVKDYDPATSTDTSFANAPNATDSYRIRLAYGDLDTLQPADLAKIETELGLAPGELKAINSTDKNAYNLGASTGQDKAQFLKDTGEIVFSKETYDKLRTKGEGEIKITYDKTKFEKNDLRPEHYFNCKVLSNAGQPDEKITDYKTADANQEIQYEISFSQKITINTEGKNSINHNINRLIQDIEKSVNDVETVENKIAEVKKMIESLDPAAPDTARQKGALEQLQSQLETEKALKEDVMQKSFEHGITIVQEEQSRIGIATADLGSRSKRLELTKTRLGDQKDDAEELKSSNEDVDMVETYIKYTAANNVYSASLSSAAKLIKNSLLDFL